MKNLFPKLIISLLFIIIPLSLCGQFDSFFMLEEDIISETHSEKEINLITFDLYWSADTYTPFGYQGRTLPVKEAWVDVSAYLKISGENPKNLKYSWFLDGIFQDRKSGYGQDSFRFGIRRSKGMSHEVLLKIFNESRSFLIEKSITVPITSPEVIIYSQQGSFNVLADKKSSFLALPYFFSIKTLEDLEFNWTFADKSTKESSLTANVFGIKIINKEVDEMLEQTLKVFVNNKKESDQKAQKSVNINIY